MSGRKRKAEIKPAIVAYNYEDLKLLASTRKHWKAINSRVQEAAISVTTSNVFLGSEPEYLTQLFRDALWHSINYYCAHHPGITMLRKDWVLVDNVIFSMPLEETIPLMVWDWGNPYCMRELVLNRPEDTLQLYQKYIVSTVRWRLEIGK